MHKYDIIKRNEGGIFLVKKVELQSGYIADAIIETKKKRFNEKFTTIEEVNIIKQVMQNRLQQKNLNVKFIDRFLERYFNIIGGVITTVDKEIVSLKPYISDMEIRETVYDEYFIYLCLCEILICKLNNSLEHTCQNCVTECTGLFNQSHSKPNDCTKWTHDFVIDCINNIATSDRLLIEEAQSINCYTKRKNILK